MSVLRTSRLFLLPGTIATLRAELESREALGEALGVDVPDGWPPELYDADAVRWTIAWLEAHPGEAEWSMYYIALAPEKAGSRPRLVGVAGYKGGPDDAGIVEIGYGIVAEHRRRGFASEAVRGMLARAFADPRVSAVIAHTLSELTASIGVLRNTGFLFDGLGNDPSEPAAIRYVMPRSRYERSFADRSIGPADLPSRPVAT
jgi:RimJ/RimL family protein N-acetyltransferase